MLARKVLGTFLLSSLVCFASTGWARGLPQSYADVGYLHGETDDFDIEGAAIDASFGIFEYVNLRGGFTRAKTDGFPGDTPDFTEFRGGFRPHYSFTDNLDVFADVMAFNNKLNGNNNGTRSTDIGMLYRGGIRYRLFKRAELQFAGEYRGGDQNETFLVVGPVIKLTKNMHLNLKTNQSSDNSDYFAGIRIEF
jgi:hypothetical protein